MELVLTDAEMIRATQLLRVHHLRTEGKTLAEACEATGISSNTYRRWISRDRVQPFVRAMAQQALIGGLAEAIAVYPDAIERLGSIAKSGADRDATKAAQELRAILEKATDLPGKSSRDGGNAEPVPETVGFLPGFKATITKDGVTVKVSQDPVIQGSFVEDPISNQ